MKWTKKQIKELSDILAIAMNIAENPEQMRGVMKVRDEFIRGWSKGNFTLNQVDEIDPFLKTREQLEEITQARTINDFELTKL